MPKVRWNPHVLLVWAGVLASHLARAATSPIPAHDPEYLIDTWQTQDGMPDNSATAMAQTRDGYLWVGTFGGLARFNGVDFRVFSNELAPGWPDKDVVNLHVDGEGALWVSTFKNLACRHADGRWRFFGSGEGWPRDMVRTFASSTDGRLLMTLFHGGILEYSSGRFTPLPVPGAAGQGSFGFADGRDAWWSVQARFVGRYDGEQWLRVVDLPEMDPSRVAATPAATGGFWITHPEALVRYDLDGREIKRHPLPTSLGSYWSVHETRDGAVWVCTLHSGLIRVATDGTLRRWTMANGLSADSLRFVFEDRESNVWVGTNGGGLQRFKRRRFENYSLGPHSAPLNATSISARSAGGVWVATYGSGLYSATDHQLNPVVMAGEEVPHRYFQSVLEDRRGRLWVGTFGHGLALLENNKLTVPPVLQTGGKNAIALFEDSHNRLWVSDGQGISVFDGSANQPFGPEQGLPKGAVNGFAEDGENRIWVCHEAGVFRLQGDRFHRIVSQTGAALEHATCLCAGPDGEVWIGTHRQGLLRWKEGEVAAIGRGSGLPARRIHGLIDDSLGHLWMSTEVGVVRASLPELNAAAERPASPVRWLTLDTYDGLPGLDFASGRQPLCARDGDGRLWFPLLRGAAAIDPAEFKPDPTPPPLVIERISYLRESNPQGADQPISLNAPFPERLVLPPGSHQIEAHYTALSFFSPPKLQFQTKLEGRDTDWRPVSRERFVRFYDLAPRDYRLHVRASNGDGAWNLDGTTLAIAITPFYWQTTWFRVGGGVLLMALGAGSAWWSARQRHRRLRERLQSQQQRAELAHLLRVVTLSELSGSLAHEINQPLAIILSNAQAAQRLLTREPPDLEEVAEILEDIVKENRRAGSVIQHLRALLKRDDSNLQPESLNAIVEDALHLMRSDFITRSIQTEITLDPGVAAILADRIQIQQVLLNLFSNACDAMENVPLSQRQLHISTSSFADRVRVTVTDHGCGLPPGDPETVFKAFFTTKKDGLGIGLGICRSIVEVHHGRLQARANAGPGATFILELPAAPTPP